MIFAADASFAAAEDTGAFDDVAPEEDAPRARLGIAKRNRGESVRNTWKGRSSYHSYRIIRTVLVHEYLL